MGLRRTQDRAASAAAGRFTVPFWLKTQLEHDYFGFLVSIDNDLFSGNWWSGDTQGWRTETISAATGSWLSRSTDSGAPWSPVVAGLPPASIGSLALDTCPPRHLYADAAANGGVWSSTTTAGGAFFAYASVIDNLSGDPIYIPARVPQ